MRVGARCAKAARRLETWRGSCPIADDLRYQMRPRLHKERPGKAMRHTQAEPKIASLVNHRGSSPVRPRLTIAPELVLHERVVHVRVTSAPQ